MSFCQNIDRGCTLEPPRRGGSNEHPQSTFWSKNKRIGIPFCYIKVGFKGVYITRTSFPEDFFALIRISHITQ